MDVRFEDHSQFQRAAGLAALGAGALAAVAPQLQLLPATVVGSALAVALEPGILAPARRRRLAAALSCALAAAGSLIEPRGGWLLPLCGAMLGVLFALARRDAAAEPSGLSIALSAALGAVAVMIAAVALSPLASLLASLLPAWIASAASGAAFGLWTALAAIPLHVAVGADAVDAKLAALRASLPSEIRALAERAVSARRGSVSELPAGTRGDLRGLLDALAIAALELAERAGSLSGAASPAVEGELQRRSAQLVKSAAEAEDSAAQQSYQRAAEALEGQLEHFRRVRRARERALARLHEDVANLERARFSLTLLRDPSNAAELDLLQARLAPALEFPDESEPEPLAPPAGVKLA